MNKDTQIQIKISSELKEKVKEKLLTDHYYKDISKLVKDFLLKYVGEDKEYKLDYEKDRQFDEERFERYLENDNK